jgi:succinyl-diaminopimelate desuccinylase
MNEREKKILKQIDEWKEDIIEFHQNLVQIPSENPPSDYKEVAAYTESKMKEIGLATKVKRKNVIGKLSNQGSKSLILNAHFDTVEAFEGWTKDPFGGEIIDGKIYGRGSSDDKSSVTAELFAAKALLNTGVDLKGNLTLTAVGDEETGGLRGAEYLLSKNLIEGDACLLGDSPNGYPFGYCGGTMYITFIIKGKQAHGLGFPDLPAPYRDEHSGVNSINRMVKIMNFLLKLQEEFLTTETKYPLPQGWGQKVSSVNLAEIHGGNKITTVPKRCHLHCSVNTIPEQDIESIKKRIMDFVDEMRKEDPLIDITVQIPIAMEPQVINEDSEFAQSVKLAEKAVYGEEREFKLFMPSTDAHWFQERGIETILVGASRMDNNAHAADEFVYIEDLINLTKVFALTALHYLT